MALELTLPFGKEGKAKDLIFTILTKEYPLKTIELTNIIRKRYGKKITFQAVRKAAQQLVEEGVLRKEKKKYSISKGWVEQVKKLIDNLYIELNQRNPSPESIKSIEGEVSVFIFDSLNEMMNMWMNLIDDWYKNFESGDPNINVFQGTHIWEVLLYPDREKRVIEKLKKKGIKSYIVDTGTTPLDKNIKKFYTNIGLEYVRNKSLPSFDKSYYIGTYGEMIIQAKYPDRIVQKLDKFFHENTKLEELDLNELSEIANEEAEIKLTIIRNLQMANHINNSILS